MYGAAASGILIAMEIVKGSAYVRINFNSRLDALTLLLRCYEASVLG